MRVAERLPPPSQRCVCTLVRSVSSGWPMTTLQTPDTAPATQFTACWANISRPFARSWPETLSGPLQPQPFAHRFRRCPPLRLAYLLSFSHVRNASAVLHEPPHVSRRCNVPDSPAMWLGRMNRLCGSCLQLVLRGTRSCNAGPAPLITLELVHHVRFRGRGRLPAVL